jgi:hypothetical protein
MNKKVCTLLAASLLCVAVGCSTDSRDLPETYSTTVTIKLDGNPVSEATVVLEPVDKSGEATSSRGMTDADGVCSLTSFDPPVDGVVPGEYMVMVRKVEVITEPDPTEDDPDGYKVIEERRVIPQKYERFDAEGLTLTVTEDGDNEFTFDLES